MTKALLTFCCVAVLLLAGCGDSETGDTPSVDPAGTAGTTGAGTEKTLPDGVVLTYTRPSGWEAIERPSDYVLSMVYPSGSDDAMWANIQLTCDTYGGLDKPFKGRTWVAVSKSHVYYLVAAFQPEAFESYRPILDAVAGSLHWEEGSPDPQDE